MPRPHGLLLLTYLQSSYISLFHLCRLIHQVLQDTLQPRVGVRKLGVEQRSWIIIMQPCPGGRIAYWPSVCLSVRLTVACLRFTRIRKAVKTLNSLAVMMLISGFLGQSLTLPLAFFPCYLHKEIALLLLDYDLQLYILGQLSEQNVLHLQFSIFC